MHYRVSIGKQIAYAAACMRHQKDPPVPYKVLQHHDYGPNCDMPGSIWDPVANTCIVPGGMKENFEAIAVEFFAEKAPAA